MNYVQITLLILVVSAVLGALVPIIYNDIDCINRESYWNKKGMFVDNWEYHTKCEYPEIPSGDSK
jgi:hypothetical protein